MELNQLLAVSHEFKMPLAIIAGNVETLERYYKLGKLDELDFLKYTSGMRRNCNRLARMTKNLIDLLRLQESDETGIFERINLNSKIEDMAKQITQEPQYSQLKFDIKCKANPPHINGDVEKLERIFLNLVSNTYKYASKNAKITIEISEKNGNIHLQLRNNGPAIPSEKADVIFQPFVRLGNTLTQEVEGSGLGLPIVKKLVEMQNGKVWINSEKSGFCIELSFPQSFSESLQIGQADDNPQEFQRIMEVELA